MSTMSVVSHRRHAHLQQWYSLYKMLIIIPLRQEYLQQKKTEYWCQ